MDIKSGKTENKQEHRLSVMSEVATLYYKKHMTQAEIAKMLFMSRPSVSRLLQQAEEEGIVEIRINYHLERNYYLEEILKKQFRLREARVLGNLAGSDVLSCVGRLAADYLEERMRPGITLGMSWGRSVASVVNALPEKLNCPIKVTQIMGATVNETSSNSAQQLIRRVADVCGGQAYYLNAPLFVEDDYVCQTLRNNIAVAATLQETIKADIILTGVGVKEDTTRSRKNQNGASWLSYMNEEMKKEIDNKQALGSIAAQFFDIHSQPIDCVWAKNCIGISLNDLKKVPEVIGVAVGQKKVEAIRGAILGEYINVLVTDSHTAEELLKLDAQKA